jgi:hypothetical protein
MDNKTALSRIYGMRRANGDWFALEDGGSFRVPLFRSAVEAMRARAFNNGMLLFKPVMLDEGALKNLASVENGHAAHFWLVDDSQVNLKHGHRIAYGQLTGPSEEASD